MKCKLSNRIEPIPIGNVFWFLDGLKKPYIFPYCSGWQLFSGKMTYANLERNFTGAAIQERMNYFILENGMFRFAYLRKFLGIVDSNCLYSYGQHDPKKPPPLTMTITGHFLYFVSVKNSFVWLDVCMSVCRDVGRVSDREVRPLCHPLSHPVIKLCLQTNYHDFFFIYIMLF